CSTGGISVRQTMTRDRLSQPRNWMRLVVPVFVLALWATWALASEGEGALFDGLPSLSDQTRQLAKAALALPVAATLGAAFAFRPRRRGTPQRTPAVIHTQILLAMIGSIVMLVVGSSLARAFGVVGVAGLVRYRAKIEDPKDAGVMLASLAVGLASG